MGFRHSLGRTAKIISFVDYVILEGRQLLWDLLSARTWPDYRRMVMGRGMLGIATS